MSSSKFENLWSLMSKHNFEIPGEMISGVTCAICAKLMIEPYAAICGCQFCCACIKDYLKDGSERKCPVSNTGCCDEALEIDINVFKDVRTNHIIKTVVVKCPNNKCSVEGSLEKMIDHVNVCMTDGESCPLRLFGCVDGDVVEGCMDEHLRNNVYVHTQMLVKILNDLRKDYEEMKVILELKEKEIKELKDNLEKYKIEMNDFKEIFLTTLKAGPVEIDNGRVSALSGGSCSILEEGMLIKEQKDNSKLVEELGKIDALSKTETEIQLDQNQNSNELTKTCDDKEKTEFHGPNSKIEIAQISEKATYTFTWKFCEFSTKITARGSEKLYYSDPFYMDKYRFCLCCRIAEMIAEKADLYLELSLAIIKGNHDNYASWPMKHNIELSIVNQATSEAHKSGNYSYDTHKGCNYQFNKPMKQINKSIEGLSMPVKDIGNTNGILVNDTVVFTCSLIAPLK